jgi:MAF protein
MRLILASASPRRRELLALLGVEFEVVASGFDEESLNHARPDVLAKRLAAAKALEVAASDPQAAVLAADTMVVLRGEMLGKPVDAAGARSMLQKLRGRGHRVITGVALATPGRKRPHAAHVTSRVRMRAYTDADIDDTIARGVPFDKAGGYGIQDPALRPVQECHGCFCSVMGLPLWTVATLLKDAGLPFETSAMPERCMTCPELPE